MDIFYEHGWNPNPERSIRIVKKYQKRWQMERYRRKLFKKYEKQPNGPFSSMREGCNQTADLCLGHGVKWILEDGVMVGPRKRARTGAETVSPVDS
jgi:hypothetical protein